MTEAGYLVRMIEDLVPAAAGEVLHGDDGEEHSLAFDYGDGITEGHHVTWSCHCHGWELDASEGGEGSQPIEVARAFLHHVWPSRYGERMSTIMTETLRSLRTT